MSAATPTMRRGPVLTPMNFVTGSVHMNCRFTASMPGNMRRATLSLMMTTLSPSRAIAVVEVASGDEPHAERVEEARRDGPEPRARILFAVGLPVALDRELRGEEARIAPRHDRAERHALDARQLRDAADRFRVEPADLLGLPRVRTRPGRSPRARCRVKPVCWRCSAKSVVTSIPAPATSTNDARDLRDGEHAAAAGSCPT